MEKRVVVFLLLSLAIIFGYDYLLKELGWGPQQTQPTDSATSAHTDTTIESTQSRETSPSTVSPTQDTPRLLPEPASRTLTDHAPATEEVVEVDTPLYQAKLTTRGAALTSWELKQYRGGSPEHPAVQLVRQGGGFAGPLTTITADTTVSKELSGGLYSVEKDFPALGPTTPLGHVTFRYFNTATGLAIEKKLTFHADSYVVDVSITTRGIDGSVSTTLGTNFGIVEWGDGLIGLIGSASLVDGKVEKETPDTEAERAGSVQWAALQDKYFLSVLIPKQGSAVVVKKEGDKLVSANVRMPVSADGSALDFQLYAGPKEYDTLRAFQIGLEDTIDFGWFIFGSWSIVKAVAKPIFYVLRFLNDYTHNYGVTIVLLTVCIKMLFVPLQFKSYKSMKQMQVIQPKVLALQEKHKDDRDRLNKELIKLYRDHKVNPVGGCLPMILQMPVFVALFNILYMTIDLRQAPFMLWITDLSVQDPYYVLPLIMGATMVIQQKITPTTMDPAQAKIMLILPVFMTFLFVNFPAGLVLYWLTNNVLTIGQQVVTDRYIFKHRPVLAAQNESAGKN